MAKLFQVGSSWVKLSLVGLFSPPVGQEFPEGFAVVLVSRDPEQDILHPFTRVNVQCLATVHKGVDDGGTYRIPRSKLNMGGRRYDDILQLAAGKIAADSHHRSGGRPELDAHCNRTL